MIDRRKDVEFVATQAKKARKISRLKKLNKRLQMKLLKVLKIKIKLYSANFYLFFLIYLNLIVKKFFSPKKIQKHNFLKNSGDSLLKIQKLS